MTHAAKVLADSISPDGVRLTTLEVTFPRIVLAEFNTHRVFSRNSASSRAIPIEKMIRMVNEHPFIPTHWGKNQKGMQAEEEIDGENLDRAVTRWLWARDSAVTHATALLEHGVHKQITNRLLEPFMWHTCIVSSTEWANWDHLRRNEKAHPEIRLAAERMCEAMEASTPQPVAYGTWHMPLTLDEERLDFSRGGGSLEELLKISVARCARVSYLTHEGKRDIQADLDLYDRLLTRGHMSPFEHVARPMLRGEEFSRTAAGIKTVRYEPTEAFCGNFRGWVQLRKTIPNEHDILGARS